MFALAALATLCAAAAVAFAVLWHRERSGLAACELAGHPMRRLALLAENAHDILLMVDEEGRIVQANAAAVAAYGWSREELQGLRVWQLRADKSRDVFDGRFVRARAGERLSFESIHARRDGSTFPVEVTTGTVEFDGRRWILSIVRDVGARKVVETALRESEARFREAFHGATLGIVLVDGRGNLVEWNDALERMFGYSAEELAALKFQDLLLPEDRAGSIAAFGALVRGERDHNDMERRYVRKDGRVIHLRYRVGALRDPAGKLNRAIGIVEDVTARIEAEAEKRRMQAQLALADRMASLGTLAAGIAHELNNPLSYVVGNVDVARAALADLAEGRGGAAPLAAAIADVREALDEASDGAGRVREIVGDLRVFSAPGGDAVDEVVDVRAVLQSSLNLARRLIMERARLETALDAVPLVSGSAARLGQVFLNLLVNAAQAIPEGSPETHRVRARACLEGDGRVAVEITDTGVGIEPETLARMFEPFYTTKPPGVGTGLGLAICQTIVAQHAGEIRVQSEPGRGSTFRVLLPAAHAGARLVPARPAQPSTRRGRILVVDDEPFVRRALERILAPRHEVILAANGVEALARLDEATAIDAVLCDVMMPDMNGMELYGEIARRAPALLPRVVFVTGAALVGEIRSFLERSRARVVEKPFSPAQILEAVGPLVGSSYAVEVSRPTPRA